MTLSHPITRWDLLWYLWEVWVSEHSELIHEHSTHVYVKSFQILSAPLLITDRLRRQPLDWTSVKQWICEWPLWAVLLLDLRGRQDFGPKEADQKVRCVHEDLRFAEADFRVTDPAGKRYSQVRWVNTEGCYHSSAAELRLDCWTLNMVGFPQLRQEYKRKIYYTTRTLLFREAYSYFSL